MKEKKTRLISQRNTNWKIVKTETENYKHISMNNATELKKKEELINVRAKLICGERRKTKKISIQDKTI